MSVVLDSYPDDCLNAAYGDCNLCLCFTDTDIIVDPGTAYFLSVVVTGTPSDGETFTLGLTTFTFRAAPAGPLDIAISGVPATQAILIRTALANHPRLNVVDYTLASGGPLFGVVANKIGTEFNLTFSTTTAPLAVFILTLGTDTIVLADYLVKYEILAEEVLGAAPPAVDLPAKIIKDLYIDPRFQRNTVTGALEVAELCAPISSIVRSLLTLPLPFITPPSFPTLYWYDARHIRTISVRYASVVAGVESGYIQSPDFTIINASCSDIIPDMTDYCSDVGGPADVWKFMFENPEKKFCAGSRVWIYIYLPGGTDFQLHYVNSSGADTFINLTVPFHRQGSVLVFPLHELLVDPTGTVGIEILGIADPLTNSEFLEVEFVDESYCCCKEEFQFLNRLGAWEIFETSCPIEKGIEVQAADYVRCKNCFDSGSKKTYSKTSQETYSAYTKKYFPTEETVNYLSSFLSSPEIYKRDGDDYHQVELDASEFALKDGEGRIQLKLEYRKIKKEHRSVND